jgi:hypothetical protein
VLPTEQKLISGKETVSTTVKPSNVSGALHSEAKNSTLRDDVLNETDPVKLERKRRQQQKKEEFLQQMKRHKSDDGDGASVSTVIKSETTSPIPEGLCFILDCYLIPCFAHWKHLA